MRKVFVYAIALLIFAQVGAALDRQPNADYRARRQALASKTSGGVVILFAPDRSRRPKRHLRLPAGQQLLLSVGLDSNPEQLC